MLSDSRAGTASRTPVILSWSGGKDSALALHALSQDEGVEVAGLLTSVTRDYDRVSVHGVRRSLLHEQARRLGLPLFEVWLGPGCTNEAYEAAFLAALAGIRAAGVSRIAFGDLFLRDVREYREKLLATTGFAPLFPLWGLDTALLARRFVREGFAARLVCVDTQQLDGSFAGRDFDERLLSDLPADVDPCGERGEFHTFVFDGPIFSRPIACRTGASALRDGRFMFCDLEC
ncbi:MAG: hypothetical protein WEA80_08170 [Gemmatimonadaceae bacterium]